MKLKYYINIVHANHCFSPHFYFDACQVANSCTTIDENIFSPANLLSETASTGCSHD